MTETPTTVLRRLEQQIRADMDDMEPMAPSIAMGLYRALGFVQQERENAQACPVAEQVIAGRLDRVRAAVTLAAPDHITPIGQRVILAALNDGGTDD